MEKDIRSFLEQYLGRGNDPSDTVLQYDIDCLMDVINSGYHEDLAEKIIEYGTAHPEAPFWDFLTLGEPGLYGITQEELMQDDE